MLRDSSHYPAITRTLEDQEDIQILNESTAFKRAKFWFWPIVFGGTIIFGFFDGIKGAFVGFLYGVAMGLFLLHESLRGDKQ